jgi:hypothetical protein
MFRHEFITLLSEKHQESIMTMQSHAYRVLHAPSLRVHPSIKHDGRWRIKEVYHVAHFNRKFPSIHCARRGLVCDNAHSARAARKHNNQRMAAGVYRIKLASDRFLLLSNTTTGESQFLMVSPVWGDAIQSPGGLVFHTYDGSHHYLFQVRIPGRGGYSELMPTRSERQMMLAVKSSSASLKVEEALASPAR